MAVETPSLLIVHQNLNMAKTLATLLAKEYNVYIAKLASHVADMIESNRIRLVLASQQLPDSTGLALFSELRLSHPLVIRILLISDADKDGANVEEALAGEIIHRYLTEPLRSSHFLTSIRKGMELYASRADAISAPEAEQDILIPPQPAQLFDQPALFQEEPPAEDLTASDAEPVQTEEAPTPPIIDEVDRLEAVGLNYELMLQQQHEVRQALERLEEKQQRIEQLEAVQKQLTEDKEQLLEKMMQLQRENAALAVLRQENAEMREEVERSRAERDRELEAFMAEAAEEIERLKTKDAHEIDRLKTEAAQEAERLKAEAALEIDGLRAEIAGLSADNESLSQEAEALRTGAETAQSEAQKLREELNRMGMLKALGTATPVTAAELQQSIDHLEIYSKAAEWYMQASQLQRLNKMLEMNVQKCQVEISRLHDGMASLRSQFEQDQAKILRQSRQVEEQYRTLRHKSDVQEASCNRLKMERDELAQKVLWMQTQWKAKLDQNGEG